MNNLDTVTKLACELVVGPIEVKDAPVGEVVELLHLHAVVAHEEKDPENYPPGIPIVYLEPFGTAPRTVTLSLPALPLATALGLLANQAALIVGYYPTGIIISRIDPPKSLFQGFDAEPAASPVDPPALPAAPAVQPPPESLAGVISKYPFIGEYGNVAGVRFFELFDVFRDTGTNLEALVELITVYPTRTVRLACDRDR